MISNKTVIRTRFAPSPTGYLHVGSLRAALFEYAYGKTYNGEFILRIEDTDRKRYVEGAVEGLIKALHVFGIEWDEGPVVNGPYAPYIQSERIKSGIYKDAAEKLVKEGNAYYCFCDAKDKEEIKKLHNEKKTELRDPCREMDSEESLKRIESGSKYAIRLKVPDEGEISYHDIVIGKDVKWHLKDVDEAMLLKSDGFPTYHLAVVVDDVIMKINPILRGLEWMPSTPIHLLLYKYLGEDAPQIGHFSLILDPDGGKLSKRKGNVSCEAFLEDGYLPEALLNFVMLLGWSPKDNRELFTLPEYVKEFKNGNLQIANAVFNREKLDWFNGQYIRKTQNPKLKAQIYELYKGKYDEELIEKIIPLIKERISKLSEFEGLAGFFFEAPDVDKDLLGSNHVAHLQSAYEVVSKIENWNIENINGSLMKNIADKGFKTGDFFMDLRIAITGIKFTPPINESIIILGKDETMRRLEKVIKLTK